jgi:hypothetical protein
LIGARRVAVLPETGVAVTVNPSPVKLNLT